MQGIVRRVQPEGDGQYRVGIEWLRTFRGPAESPRTAVRQGDTLFLPFCGLRLACRVLRQLADRRVCVRLPNGSEHEITEDTLVSATKAQRQCELEQPGQELTMLLGIYQLGNEESSESAIQVILDLEYGDSWN